MNSAFSMTSWQGGRMKNTYITQPQFAMIWFGAALSIAEIMTGTYLAPLRTHPRSICYHTGAYHRRHTALGAGLIGGRLRQGSMNTPPQLWPTRGLKALPF